MGAVKAKEKEMKEEKEAERQVSYPLNLREEFQRHKSLGFYDRRQN